ncbi:peroxiredoxin C [Candidatus Providencia siddallii]|uniref:Thioredoxin peroxidase n=1 Tax=Candidatus Providencia siddallii TaxID=1715285 RepID=A0ABM9NPF6_9GAMM
MTLVAREAPDFIAPAVLSNGEIIKNFHLKNHLKNHLAIIFFWPMDFTFVCPSELIAFNNRYEKFKEQEVKIIGISSDSEFVHNAWRKTSINNGGIGKIKFPMIADTKHEIMKSYKIEHPEEGVALRASFLIDKKGIVRHQIINDLAFGRNIDEMLRMVDALQFHEKNGEACPAQWEKGKEGINTTERGIANFLIKNANNL